MANMIVSGAGTTAVNGTYVENGELGGRPYYENGDYAIVWDLGWQVGYPLSSRWITTQAARFSSIGFYCAGSRAMTISPLTRLAGRAFCSVRNTATPRGISSAW